MRNYSNPLTFILPFIALLASSVSLVFLHFPQGHDWMYELVRIAQFKSAILNGQFPPYWGEDLYGGYGSPIYLFYAPLFSFVSTICSFATTTIASGSSLALLLFSIVGFYSMKLLVQESLGENIAQSEASSRIAASFYILNPYLLSDKLLRNANAEYAALCLVPLSLYGLLLIRRNMKFGILVLSIGLAMTILAHNLTALIVILLTGTAALVYYWPEKKPMLWLAVFGSMAVGLGLSAFFWLPAIYYKSLVNIDQMTAGKLDFHNQFPSLLSFLGGSLYSIGLFLPALLFVLWKNRDRTCTIAKKIYYFALASAGFFVFLQTPLSLPVWELVPFMPLFQFPWRMMGPLAVVASMAVGFSAAYALNGKPNKDIALHEAMILLLCILNAAPVLAINNNMPKDLTLQLPHMLKGETIRLKGFQATVLDEYLPRSASADIVLHDRFKDGTGVKSFPEIETKVMKNTGTTVELKTFGGTSATLQFSRWYFPGWSCRINGMEKAIQMNKFGSFYISIPPGHNHVIVQLSPPYMRRMGLWLSFSSLIVWIIIAFKMRLNSRP